MKHVLIIVLFMLLHITASAERVTTDLYAYYPMTQAESDTIFDQSGYGHNLVIEDTTKARLSVGHLWISSPTKIESIDPVSDLIVACGASNEYSVEVWMRNANVSLTGPARIVSVSESGTAGGNFMFGQDLDGLVIRTKTTTSDQYGNPSMTASQILEPIALRHVVFTRDTAGDTKLYIDGVLRATSFIDGSFSNWGDHTLTLASESQDTGQRSWVGELHLVAVYARALTEIEVIQNFTADDIVLPIDPEYNPLVNAIASWDAPTYGTPVVKYKVEWSVDGGPWVPYALTTQEHVSIQITFFNEHRMRVCGIDADDRQGPFSQPSNVYCPAYVRTWPPSQPVKE